MGLLQDLQAARKSGNQAQQARIKQEIRKVLNDQGIRGGYKFQYLKDSVSIVANPKSITVGESAPIDPRLALYLTKQAQARKDTTLARGGAYPAYIIQTDDTGQQTVTRAIETKDGVLARSTLSSQPSGVSSVSSSSIPIRNIDTTTPFMQRSPLASYEQSANTTSLLGDSVYSPKPAGQVKDIPRTFESLGLMGKFIKETKIKNENIGQISLIYPRNPTGEARVKAYPISIYERAKYYTTSSAGLFSRPFRDYAKGTSYKNTGDGTVTGRVINDPFFLVAAPAVVASAPSVSANIVRVSTLGYLLGKTSARTIDLLGSKTQRESFEFKTLAPVAFESAVGAGREAASKNANWARKFFNLEVGKGTRESFVEGGLVYLKSKGYSPKELLLAETSLRAQSYLEPPKQISQLFTYELVGEGFGGGIVKNAATTTAKKASSVALRLFGHDTEEALIRTAAKKEIREYEARLFSSQLGGHAEAAAAYGGYTELNKEKPNPDTFILQTVLGGLTARTFERFRVSPVSSKSTKRIATAVGNIIEPQEYISDTALTYTERSIGRIAGRSQRSSVKTLSASWATEWVGGAPSTSSSLTTSKQKTPNPSDSIVNDLLFSGTRENSRDTSEDVSTSLIDSRSTSKEKTRNLIDEFVLTTTKTKTRVEETSLTRSLERSVQKTRETEKTRSLTPDIPFINPFRGGTSSWFLPKGSRGKTKKGYSRSIAGDIFGKFYKGIGAKSTLIGIKSGLGVRF